MFKSHFSGLNSRLFELNKVNSELLDFNYILEAIY